MNKILIVDFSLVNELLLEGLIPFPEGAQQELADVELIHWIFFRNLYDVLLV